MGLFGSRKKVVDVDGLPSVPPRFAPEEVHTAYKEALKKDALPSTLLPPDPQSLQQSPVQDSLSPVDPRSSNQSFSESSDDPFVNVAQSSSLDDAVNTTQSEEVSPAGSPLADVPVSTDDSSLSNESDESNESLPDVPLPDSNSSPEELPLAPSPEPDFSSPDMPAPSPSSLDDAVNTQNDSRSSLSSAPDMPAPVQSTYSPNPSSYVQNYSGQSSSSLPEEFPSPDVQSSDDLSPIIPLGQSPSQFADVSEPFDESLLPEIGVPVDEYTSNMAAKPEELVKEPVLTESLEQESDLSSSPDVQQSSLPPLDLEPPQRPEDLPSTMPVDNPDDLVAPELAPLPTNHSTNTATYNDVSTPQSPPVHSSSLGSVSPIEERVIIKHAVGTDVFVEKLVYEDVLLDVSGVQEYLQHAGSHLDKVLRDELAVTKKIDDWNKDLNTIQEKLMAVDLCLFEKGDV